jgi:UDP-glucose 4-epimerase
VAAVERVSGRPVPRREVARRPGDPPELVADPALANSRLGWQPAHSDIDTIVRTALAWETRRDKPATADNKS